MTESQKVPASSLRPEQRFYDHDGTESIDVAIEALGIPRDRSVVVVVGWAGTKLPDWTQDCLGLLLRDVLAPVCRDQEVVIVSGGTDAGVMGALGQELSYSAPGVVLVGVAPHAKLIGFGASRGDPDAAAPEPRHRVITTPGDAWGAEGPYLIRVAERIAGERPLIVLAVGGGNGTLRELALASRRRWPVLLVTGHGGTSDQVAAFLSQRRPRAVRSVHTPDQQEQTKAWGAVPHVQLEDLRLAAEAGCYYSVPLADRAAMDRGVRWPLSGDAMLKESWTRFAQADHAAINRKKPTSPLAAAVLVLATSTVICGAAAAWLYTQGWAGELEWLVLTLKGLTTALPLVAAILLGLMERRANTGSWIDQRATAETILRETYRYRAAVDPYTHENGPSRLAETLASVDLGSRGVSALVARPVNRPSGRDSKRVKWAADSNRRSLAARHTGPAPSWPPRHLTERVHCSDSLVQPLTAGVYDRARVQDQIQHFEQTAQRFDRKATRLALAIFVVASLAAFLLATSWKWSFLGAGSAAAASVAAAMVSWREFQQRDARTEAMLSTLVAVRGARARWLALPPESRNSRPTLAIFAGEVESALADEGSNWERAIRQTHQSYVDRQKGR